MFAQPRRITTFQNPSNSTPLTVNIRTVLIHAFHPSQTKVIYVTTEFLRGHGISDNREELGIDLFDGSSIKTAVERFVEESVEQLRAVRSRQKGDVRE